MVSPSILAVGEDVAAMTRAAQAVPSADYLHIDVMDGKFVPQSTMYVNPMYTSMLSEATEIPLDVHLMVEDPENYVDRFIEADADLITFHYEATKRPITLIERIREGGLAGIALNPETPVSEVFYLLHNLDVVLLMSVNPGKCGQDYIEDVTGKIRELKEVIRREGYDIRVEVDGGVKLGNRYKPINAGADILVSGSGIYSLEDPDQGVIGMRDTILIGCDHGGMELKGKIMSALGEKGYAYSDVGTYSTRSCDYTDIANIVASEISSGGQKRGILVCGTGQGMAMAANRFHGVRAAVGYSEFAAVMAREHNDARVICFGERSMDHGEVVQCMHKFLETDFSGDERHEIRLEKFI